MVYRTGIKHQAAGGLSCLYSEDEDNTSLRDKAPVLTVSQKKLACVPQMEIPDFEVIEKL